MTTTPPQRLHQPDHASSPLRRDRTAARPTADGSGSVTNARLRFEALSATHAAGINNTNNTNNSNNRGRRSTTGGMAGTAMLVARMQKEFGKQGNRAAESPPSFPEPDSDRPAPTTRASEGGSLSHASPASGSSPSSTPGSNHRSRLRKRHTMGNLSEALGLDLKDYSPLQATNKSSSLNVDAVRAMGGGKGSGSESSSPTSRPHRRRTVTWDDSEEGQARSAAAALERSASSPTTRTDAKGNNSMNAAERAVAQQRLDEIESLRERLSRAHRALLAARNDSLARSIQHHAAQTQMRLRTARLRAAIVAVSEAAGDTKGHTTVESLRLAIGEAVREAVRGAAPGKGGERTDRGNSCAERWELSSGTDASSVEAAVEKALLPGGGARKNDPQQPPPDAGRKELSTRAVSSSVIDCALLAADLLRASGVSNGSQLASAGETDAARLIADGIARGDGSAVERGVRALEEWKGSEEGRTALGTTR